MYLNINFKNGNGNKSDCDWYGINYIFGNNCSEYSGNLYPWEDLNRSDCSGSSYLFLNTNNYYGNGSTYRYEMSCKSCDSGNGTGNGDCYAQYMKSFNNNIQEAGLFC